MILNKKNPLRASYFFVFILMIVIPILLIIIFSFYIMKNIMMKAAIEQVSLAQENVVSNLQEEINDIMLRLSHIVHSNNSHIIELAEKATIEDEKKRYKYIEKLNTNLQYIMTPFDDILCIDFFMKDSSYVSLKDDLLISEKEIKNASWYQNALHNKAQVYVGSYSSYITYTVKRENQFTLAAGIAPDNIMDRGGKTELVMLLMLSKTGYIMNSYNKQKNLGTMVLIDKSGEIILNTSQDTDIVLPHREFLKKEGIYHNKGKKVTYKIASIENTDWKLVNIINTKRLLQGFNKVAIIIILITLLLFIFFIFFSEYFLKGIIHPINEMIEGLKQLENGDLQIHLNASGQFEIRNMIHSFNRMVRRLRESLEKTKDEQQKKYLAEMKALQSQINPHFLVNTLNSIRFIAKVSKFDGIKNMTESLIKILSCSFRSNTSFYSLEEELEVLKSYVFLMEIRYTEGFEVFYNIDEKCLLCTVPRLILQPIVENSIVHGFDEMEEIGEITIYAYIKNFVLYIEIQDNGKGISKEEIKDILYPHKIKKDDEERISIGISNVDSRLQLHYGNHYKLQMESEVGKYTKTLIRIPQKENNENKE